MPLRRIVNRSVHSATWSIRWRLSRPSQHSLASMKHGYVSLLMPLRFACGTATVCATCPMQKDLCTWATFFSSYEIDRRGALREASFQRGRSVVVPQYPSDTETGQRLAAQCCTERAPHSDQFFFFFVSYLAARSGPHVLPFLFKCAPFQFGRVAMSRTDMWVARIMIKKKKKSEVSNLVSFERGDCPFFSHLFCRAHVSSCVRPSHNSKDAIQLAIRFVPRRVHRTRGFLIGDMCGVRFDSSLDIWAPSRGAKRGKRMMVTTSTDVLWARLNYHRRTQAAGGKSDRSSLEIITHLSTSASPNAFVFDFTCGAN
jgi:hypothetical protein